MDQWSDYCAIISIKSKIYIHNSFSGKAAQLNFQTCNEMHRHFAIFGRTIRRLEKLLAFVLLPCVIDISTRITSVKMIVLKIIAPLLQFNVKSTYTIRCLEGYQANFPHSNWDEPPLWQNRSMTCKTAWLCWCVAFRWWLFKIKVKVWSWTNWVINQKSIGKTIPQKHFLKWKM